PVRRAQGGLVRKFIWGCKAEPQAHGKILLPGDVAEALHEFSRADRRQPERLRPLREGTRRSGRTNVLSEVVPWVGGQRDGNAQPGACSQFLQLVLPLSKCLGVVRRPDHVEVAELLLLD